MIAMIVPILQIAGLVIAALYAYGVGVYLAYDLALAAKPADAGDAFFYGAFWPVTLPLLLLPPLFITGLRARWRRRCEPAPSAPEVAP